MYLQTPLKNCSFWPERPNKSHWNGASTWPGRYGACACLHYTWDYFTPGLCSLIMPAAMEKLMSFMPKSTHSCYDVNPYAWKGGLYIETGQSLSKISGNKYCCQNFFSTNKVNCSNCSCVFNVDFSGGRYETDCPANLERTMTELLEKLHPWALARQCRLPRADDMLYIGYWSLKRAQTDISIHGALKLIPMPFFHSKQTW